jgi:hypothetical protein
MALRMSFMKLWLNADDMDSMGAAGSGVVDDAAACADITPLLRVVLDGA